jgi:hypothetical protein
MSTLATAALTGLVTLAVCLINNFYQNKRHAEDTQAANKKHSEEVHARYAKELADFKDGFTGHLEIISKNQSDLAHSIDMVNFQISELSKDVSKHNQVIERTYALERRADVQDEMIKVANNRIKDLEVIEREREKNHD